MLSLVARRSHHTILGSEPSSYMIVLGSAQRRTGLPRGRLSRMDEGVNDVEALDRFATGAAFLRVAARRPHAVALRWDLDSTARSMTYGELARCAGAVARRILVDLQPADRLAIWSANCPEWIIAQLAAALAGVVLVPMNPALTECEARFTLTSSGAKAVLAGPVWRGRDLAAEASAIRGDEPTTSVHLLTEWVNLDGETANDPAGDEGELPVVAPEDLLVVQYTSGTTGTPKGAMLFHLVGTNVGPLSHRALGLTESDVVCSPLPLHHVGGSVCTVLAALLRGATFILLPGFDVEQTLTSLDRAKATFFGGVPTILLTILEKCGGVPPDLPALRVMMVGGTTVSPSLITTIEQAFGVEVTNGYGQSEAPSALQTRVGDSSVVKALTIGRANPHREVGILDHDGTPVPTGAVGEPCLRSELTMEGYWEERDASHSSAIDDAGWLHTGDVASQDAAGVVTLHGRLRDVIIRGGRKHLSRGGRGSAGHPPRHRRCCSRRCARPALGRGPGGVRADGWPDDRPGGPRDIRTGPPRGLQGAAHLATGLRVSAHRVGQDPKV
jgi:acyl-CoA synthetase (AMP-forming)/AMP-acid ligase II